MQKYKYALDLQENIYSLNSNFDTYKLSSDEIKKLHSVPISDNDSNYIGKEIVYDHTYIYLTPKEFIEQHKLSNDKKTELYKNIGKIKIKEINPENIKDISFILHHILKMKAQEEADVQAYEMPISSSWQYIPFNQRMNFSIENIFNRQNKAINTQEELDNYVSVKSKEKLSLSDEATHILNQDQEESKTVNNLYKGLVDFNFDIISDSIEAQKIDINRDGKTDVNVKDMAEVSNNSINNRLKLRKNNNSEVRQKDIKLPYPLDNINKPWSIPPELENTFNFSPVYNGTPIIPLSDIKENISNIKDAAKLTNIDPALLTGVLLAERLRIGFFDDYIGDHASYSATKGFSQIGINAALEGQKHYCAENNIPFNEDKERKEIEKNIFSDKENIEYAAKYIDLLRDEFPVSKNLTQKDQYELVAASYKMGPDTIKNARMQQQINDLSDSQLVTDGYPGSKTNEVIYDILNKNRKQLQNNKKYATDIDRLLPPKEQIKDYKNLYLQQDYTLIRAIINTLWEQKHPSEYNPPGIVPDNKDKFPEERVDYDLQDVFEGMKLYNKHVFN